MSKFISTMSFKERFWSKVNQRGDCWEWSACINTSGYGSFMTTIGKAEPAHRVSWVMKNGAIPDGLCVLHKCDNRKCVNPAHLFLGTKKDNAVDMVSKGRSNKPKGEKCGKSKLTDIQVVEIRNIGRSKSFKEIAAIYGIKKSNVGCILNNQTWRHLTTP